MALQDALTELVKVVQFRDRDRACCYGLSVSQCYALRTVVRDGPLSVNELAAELVLEKSTASRLAAGLVDSGYVRKVPDPDDARSVRIEATPQGYSMHEQLGQDLAVQYGKLLSDFSWTERARVVEALRRLASAVSRGVETAGGRCCVVE